MVKNHVRPSPFWSLYKRPIIPNLLRGISCMLYANDAQVYDHFIPDEIMVGIVNMQQNAQAVFDWATQNGIEFNVRKTKGIISKI